MSIFWIVVAMRGIHLLQELGPSSNCVQESGLKINFIFDKWYKFGDFHMNAMGICATHLANAACGVLSFASAWERAGRFN
jgi:hypothetical protein